MKTKLNGILTLLLAFFVHFSYAQDKAITGTVTDQNGLPLPGVNVLIKDTTTGTQSDFDGNYSIKASEGQNLIFTYVGQKSVTRLVGAATTINLQMEEDAEALEEVVVTGYTSQRKSDITGSIVKVGAEELSKVVTSTVDQALQGNVSGLAVTASSGTPGATSNIRIRGISSITAGNEPLYVIDGVPVNNSNASSSASTAISPFSTLSGLDQNNIEAITVLKDASATAQYGARGANGVILITTKSGKSGKTKFSINSSYGFQNDAIKGPVVLTAAQRLELASEAYFNDGFFESTNEASDFLLNNDSAFKAWDEAGRREANWGAVVSNDDAPIQQHSFSASGGKDGDTFFANLGYMEQLGTVIGTGFERISGALNISKKLTDRFTFNSNNSVAYSEQKAFLETSAYFSGARTAKFFLSPLVYPYNDDGTPAEFGGSLPNPLILTKENFNNNRLTRILSNNSVNWDIGKGFSWGSVFNVDYQIYNFRSYSNRNYGYGAATSGDASQYIGNNVFYVFQNYLDYNLNINDNHNLDFKVLQEYQTNRNYFLGGAGENFADDGLFNLDNTGTPTSVNSSFNDYHVGAYLGLLKYAAFNSKYILDLSYRREGNSRFGPKNRWGNFWAVGTAWNIHKENFLADSKVVNNLKLRGSFGVTGNANISLNQYQSLFSFDGDYAGEGSQAVSTFGNEDLSWEKSATLDVGIDFGLFSNLVTGSFAYFNRESTDLLLDVPLSQTTGFNSQTQNIGALTNKGFEVDVKFNIINTDDVNFSIAGNLGTVENEITTLPLDPNGVERTITTTRTRIETGHPVLEWYMPTWAGVNPETGIEEWFINGIDGEKTAVFNDAEAVFQGGNAVPTFTAGLNLNFDYKGFFISANGYYSGGNKLYDGWHRYTSESNAYPLFAFQGFNTLLDRWQQPGDIARNGKLTSDFGPGWQSHSKYLYDGDFFRLRSVSLGYSLPTDAAEKLGMTKVRFFVLGNNLFTWVKDDNLIFDPEVDLGGITGLETPPTRLISLGINLNF